jgi:hypothetical protein
MKHATQPKKGSTSKTRNIMMSPIFAKERSGPNLTSGFIDHTGKGDIMAEASIGGRKGPRHQRLEAN